ncbi:MAG: LysR family transcriptional regulator [Tissierellia bacterium]|nr:LysR family transcriptional regulator [Tissierellia bacterium]
MKISNLEHFLAAAESKSINGAAKKLYRSQPNISKSIRQLENELGFKVFNRSSNGIELTENGRNILDEAKQIVEIYNSWLELSDQDQLESIDIHIYVSFSDLIINNILLEFRKLFPEIKIKFEVGVNPEAYITRSMKEPSICLVMLMDEEYKEKLVQIQADEPLKLLQGEYRALVNVDNPISKKPSLTAKDLEKMYLLLPCRKVDLLDTDLIPKEIQMLMNEHFTDNYLEIDSLSNVLNMVKNHPESYALTYHPADARYEGIKNSTLKAIPIEGIDLRASLYLFYSKKAYASYEPVRFLVKTIRGYMSQYN